MSMRTGARKAQPQDRRVCKRCDHTKPIELFKKSGTGRGHVCKVCDAERARKRWRADIEASRAKRRARRQRNLEQERAQGRERARSERGRAINRRATARYRRNNPEIVAAQAVANKALRRGELRVALVCEVRGCHESKRLQLHHPDYRRPKEAVRVCHRCHEHLHHRGPLELKPGGRWKWARAPRTGHGIAVRTSR